MIINLVQNSFLKNAKPDQTEMLFIYIRNRLSVCSELNKTQALPSRGSQSTGVNKHVDPPLNYSVGHARKELYPEEART